jgi:hypothetical protein
VEPADLIGHAVKDHGRRAEGDGPRKTVPTS